MPAAYALVPTHVKWIVWIDLEGNPELVSAEFRETKLTWRTVGDTKAAFGHRRQINKQLDPFVNHLADNPLDAFTSALAREAHLAAKFDEEIKAVKTRILAITALSQEKL